jgi:hypothetical protein
MDGHSYRNRIRLAKYQQSLNHHGRFTYGYTSRLAYIYEVSRLSRERLSKGEFCSSASFLRTDSVLSTVVSA